MSRRHLNTIIAALVCCASTVCTAQPSAVDFSAGMFQWLPTSSFKDVSGIPGPQSITFKGATSTTRGSLRLGADIIDYEHFALGADVSYMPVSMMYTAQERAPIAVQGGGLYIATLRHDISAQMDVWSLAPRVRVKPLSWLSFEVRIPLSVISDPRYTQVMRFTDPAGLAFVDGRTEQVTGRGRIVNVRTIVPSVAAHLQAEIPLGVPRSITLLPRLGYQQSLQSISGDGAYWLQGVDASIGVRIALKRSDPTEEVAIPSKPDTQRDSMIVESSPIILLDTRVERDTLVELRPGIQQTMTDLANVVVDTVSDQQVTYRRVRETYRTYIPKPPSVLRGSVALRFVDEDGTITNNARLTATRVSSQRIVPFVPFVVFDEGSTQIPHRYVQLDLRAAAQFQERLAVTSDTHWHYNILNIVGSRMRAQKQTTCQLQLYASCSDTAVGNTRLRAVQSYLSSRYGVRESRITLIYADKGLTDDHGSTMASSVVISDPSGKLLRPVEGQLNFVEARLPTVRIAPDVISEAGVRQWHVSINQGLVERYVTADSTGDVRDITVDLNDVMSADVALKSPLAFILHLQDNEGTTTASEPATLKLTSKALRPSERATPLRRTEVLRIAGNSAIQQQISASAGQRVLNAPAWSVNGLVAPESTLYESGSKVYIQEERQP